MSHFVERQGKKQDRERDENLREVDVYGSLIQNGLALGSGLWPLGRPKAKSLKPKA
jgi:hypothetical protein